MGYRFDVLINQGHGQGKEFNRGYIGPKYKNEGDSNFVFGWKLAPALEKYGMKVGLTRFNSYENPDLDVRGRMGKGCRLLISCHTNAGSGQGRGTEAWVDVNKGDDTLARNIVNSTCKALGTVNRGVRKRYLAGTKDDWYAVLRYNEAEDGLLLESAFHDKADDIEKYETNIDKAVEAVAYEIAKFYGFVKQNQTIKSTNVVKKESEDVKVANIKDLRAIGAPTWSEKANGVLATKGENLVSVQDTFLWQGATWDDSHKQEMRKLPKGTKIEVVDMSYRRAYLYVKCSDGVHGYVYVRHFR